jgi:REP element-mobilizing transposase RayT
LRGYDYAQVGAYFVTIVTHQRELLFDNIVFRKVAETMWERIPRNFRHVELDEWVVMPNHVHGILWIVDVGTRHSVEGTAGQEVPDNEFPLDNREIVENASPLRKTPAGLTPGSLGAIVGNFKSVSARRINKIRNTPGEPVWHRNYYDHIIRDENDLMRVRRYILENPIQWDEDAENPLNA